MMAYLIFIVMTVKKLYDRWEGGDITDKFPEIVKQFKD